MNGYVCAFRGRRDSYQAPLALAEGGLLDQFITDAYATRLLRTLGAIGPERIRTKIDARSCDGIPVDRVTCLWGTSVVEHGRHAFGCDPTQTFETLDPRFSRAASRRAAATGANLLLYSPYAWEAFTSRYAHDPRKVLFQYHPHGDLEEQILAADAGASAPPSRTRDGERNAWRYADLILCASTFSRHSLLEAGAPESTCRVIPYGVTLPPEPQYEAPETFRALFVGTGTRRKGLHHLLTAWSRAALPPSSTLVLVCRHIDPAIARMAAATPGVRLLRRSSQARLQALYTGSSLFVMPSLVEGFGQVYLEALAHGTPVLGTPNTALPDLGTEADGVFVVPPGDVDALSDKLERLASALSGDRAVRRAARRCAARFTWPAFRASLRRALNG